MKEDRREEIENYFKILKKKRKTEPKRIRHKRITDKI